MIKEQLFQYLHRTFPDFIGQDVRIRTSSKNTAISLPFELGEPYENGTDERIKQVINRVTTLFEELFSPYDMIYIFLKDYQQEDPMFGNPTPDYVYHLLSKYDFEEEKMYELDYEPDEIYIEYKLRIIYDQVKSLPYKEIFQGIAHYEQGREPAIGQTIFFISTEKGLLFDMYDDRGCRIYADSTDKLQKLYRMFPHWINDYYREWVENTYKKQEGPLD